MRSILVLALGALLVAPGNASAQGGTPGWSPWGGPDSPGGMFGGSPFEADADRDRAVTHDEVWTWLRRRFDTADRDRSGTLEPTEIPGSPQAQAGFRAADADRNGRVTVEELRPLSEAWFRAQDVDRNGKLTRREVPKPTKPKPTPAPAPAPG
jgi:hypothetical protein